MFFYQWMHTFDFQKYPFNCFDTGENIKKSKRHIQRFLESEEKSSHYPILVKTSQGQNNHETKCKKSVKWCWEQTRDWNWPIAVHLRWVCWDCWTVTHHWAHMPAFSFVSWWSWHSLQMQIWGATQSQAWNGNKCKLKYSMWNQRWANREKVSFWNW